MISWFILWGCARAGAGSFEHRAHVEAYAQHRDLNQRGFLNSSERYEGFVLADVIGTWTGESVFAEVKPQVRAAQSPGVGRADLGGVSTLTSPRWLATRRVLGRSTDAEATVDFDRLDVRYRVDAGEVYVGRRPVSLGTLRLFPVWNKLTLPLIFRAGPEWIENPDGVGATFTHQSLSGRALHLRGTDPGEDVITLGEVKYIRGGLEVQALAGQWWRHGAAGLNASTDVRGATVRFESIYFARAGERVFQWGAGVERGLGERVTLIAEYLHQNQCGSIAAGYGAAPPTRFHVLSGCDYLFPYAHVQLNGAWRAGGGAMTNLADPSAVAIVDLEYAWSDDLNLELKMKRTVGGGAAEFGPKRVTDPLGRSAGAPSSVYFGLSYTH